MTVRPEGDCATKSGSHPEIISRSGGPEQQMMIGFAFMPTRELARLDSMPQAAHSFFMVQVCMVRSGRLAEQLL